MPKSGLPQASKAAAQAKWLSKEQNRRYFQGPENVERVRAWRKKNPGYLAKTIRAPG